MALNLSVFPLVPLLGLPPELAVRSGMGGWSAYALAAPADRLLPFVLTRPTGASAWVNCAWVEHADTGARIATLLPTGQTSATPPPAALVLQKATDPTRGVEHFIYAGALVPSLALPCGVPLRLVLDNAWQSPRFMAFPDLSDFLKLEWWHAGPLGGLPYGTGLRQRLYVAGAALAYGKSREESDVTKTAATGAERIDFLALYRTATLTVEPVPPYLSEALDGAPAHQYAEIDGEAWKIKGSKPSPKGEQGGRASVELSLEQEEVVIRRAGAEPALAAAPFDPVADAPRPWRCGDEGDTAPDWQTYQRTCLEANDGTNSGYVNESQRDVNPYSASHNQTRSHASSQPDYALCPLPPTYTSIQVSGLTTRNNCPTGQEGTEVFYAVPAGQFISRISQQEADDAARTYYDATKQAYANANGTCHGLAGDYYPSYLANGCFSGRMVNRNDPADVRDATQAEYTQYGLLVNGSDGAACPAYN